MTAGYIVGSLVGYFAIACLCDTFVSDKKAFRGTTPKTVSEKEWWQATDTKFQAWPRTAGPPVVMNPHQPPELHRQINRVGWGSWFSDLFP